MHIYVVCSVLDNGVSNVMSIHVVYIMYPEKDRVVDTRQILASHVHLALSDIKLL